MNIFKSEYESENESETVEPIVIIYEKSYKIRTSRIWNTLPNHITSKDRTFSEFKNLLFKYYILALENTYDVEDPRTWKSVCIKCNSARCLINKLSIDMLLLDKCNDCMLFKYCLLCVLSIPCKLFLYNYWGHCNWQYLLWFPSQ